MHPLFLAIARMCGRARMSLRREVYEQLTGVQNWVDPGQHYQPAHNLAPGGWIPVMRVNRDNALSVECMKWGLVPSFHKQGEKLDHWRMFNARSETIHTSPVFRRLINNKRCVVLLNGFYEWKADAGGRKQPYYIYLGQPGQTEQYLPVAGLWDVTTGEDGLPLKTVTLITCDSCASLTWLHDRMPVILDSRAAVEAWLGTPLPQDSQLFSSTCGDTATTTAPDAATTAHSPGLQHNPAKGVATVKHEAGQQQAVQVGSHYHSPSKAEAHRASGGDTAGVHAGTAGAQGEGAESEPVKSEGDISQEAVKVEDEEEAEEGAGGGGAASENVLKLISQVCRPYAGKLSWHPVTPEMTKMTYQSPDACADLRTKKGTISSFFQPKTTKSPKAGSSMPVSSTITGSKALPGAVAEQGKSKVGDAVVHGVRGEAEAPAGDAEQQQGVVVADEAVVANTDGPKDAAEVVGSGQEEPVIVISDDEEDAGGRDALAGQQVGASKGKEKDTPVGKRKAQGKHQKSPAKKQAIR